MRKTFTLLFFIAAFISLSFQSNAQEIDVQLKALNKKNEPVPFASFVVTNRADSLQWFEKVADSIGKVVFRLQPGVQYSVAITSINYNILEKGITVTASKHAFDFILEQSSKDMTGVTVVSRRPLMRQEDDKTIVDPENIAVTSINAYEILEKTPGIFVDQDGNIYLSSNTPATIYINGREMKMSASDIATMLKNLPPNAIQRIEIMRTPSAKYDASGTGGIVNIILKKGVKLGLTGSVNAGLQQGVYNSNFVGLNISNNDGKKSSFYNINYNKRNTYERLQTDRIFAPDSMLSQQSFTKYPSSTYFGSAGIVYELPKDWTMDYGGSIAYNDYGNKTDNISTIRKISTNDTISNILNRIGNDGYSLNIRNGIEFTKKLDTIGSEWDNDFFYNYSRNNSDQLFFILDSPVPENRGGGGNSDNQRNLITLRSDLKLKMKKRFTFEAGAKTSILWFKSVTDYFRQENNVKEKDESRTNTFKYNEVINSAYVQGSKTFGKDIVLKTGLRLENTNMNGNQIIPFDTSFNIHRTDLFPYVYLSKTVMKIAGYDLRAYLVYRRTISRPVYEQLNPFPRYVDQFLTEIGNPGLRPQFTQNYEANVSVDERPIIAVGYNDTKDIFTNVIYQADSANSVAYRTYDNLGTNKELYFRGMAAIPPGGKYFGVVVAQYNRNFYEGLYENKPLSFKKGSWTFFTFHSLKIDKRSQATVSGFIRLKGQQQFYELGNFGALNASINRQFMKQKLLITLSVNDMFFTNKIDFTLNQGSVQASGTRINDTRRYGINLRYNFGIKKKEEGNDMFNVEGSN